MNEGELFHAYRRSPKVPTEKDALEAEQEAIYDIEDRQGRIKCLDCMTMIELSAVRVLCRFCERRRRNALSEAKP